LIISPAFAEDTTFTNDDLIIYSDEHMRYDETAHLSKDKNENAYSDEKVEVMKHVAEEPGDRREGLSGYLNGKGCDVLDFSSNKISYAVHNPDYEISGTITKQTVTVHIKSKWGMPLWVENFYIVAFFEDGTEQTKQLQPAPGDSLTSLIQPEAEYSGYVTFEGDLPIVSVGCHVIEKTS
jgi:hypothetical protein